MANKRTIVSDADAFINVINANMVANFKEGQKAIITLPSLIERALAIVNRDQTYSLEDVVVETGNETA